MGPASHLLYSAQNTKRRVKVKLSVRTITFLDVNAVEYRIESKREQYSGSAVSVRGTAAVVQVLLSVLYCI